MKVKKKTFQWIDFVPSKLIQAGYPITRLQGSANAPILLVAPVPTARTIAQNLAWADEIAEVFFTLMMETSRLSTDQFLIVPTTFDGKKPSVRNTGLVSEIIQRAALDESIKAFLCIDSPAFVNYFGHGKKPDMSLLCGTWMQLKETNYKPLMVLPSVDSLVYSFQSLKAIHGRDHRTIQELLRQQKTLLQFLERKRIFQQLVEVCQTT